MVNNINVLPVNEFAIQVTQYGEKGDLATAIALVAARDVAIERRARASCQHEASRAEQVIREIANLAHPWNSE